MTYYRSLNGDLGRVPDYRLDPPDDGADFADAAVDAYGDDAQAFAAFLRDALDDVPGGLFEVYKMGLPALDDLDLDTLDMARLLMLALHPFSSVDRARSVGIAARSELWMRFSQHCVDLLEADCDQQQQFAGDDE